MREHSSTPAVGVNGGRREDLNSVAKYQKGILWCILIQLIGGLCAGVLTDVPPILTVSLSLGLLLVSVAATILVFKLASYRDDFALHKLANAVHDLLLHLVEFEHLVCSGEMR